jgi:hypothetical protein
VQRLSFLVFLLIIFQVQGQDPDLDNAQLVDFKATHSTRGISIEWVIGKGTFCFGAELQHSTAPSDLNSWVTIYELDGVCGDQTFDISYNFLHEKPFEGDSNSYRLILGTIPTKPINLFVPIQPDELFHFGPNPANDFLNVYIDNFTGESVIISLLTLSGNEVMRLETQGFYM